MKVTQELIEIFPYGLTLSPHMTRPILVFKDKTESKVLPVWLSQMDAGITLHQNSVEMGYSSSPYSLTWKILKPLGIYLEKCCFVDIKGHQQIVELKFSGHPKLNTLKTRADEAVAFCLSNKTKFFCSDDYFEKCRKLDVELSTLGAVLKNSPNIVKNTQRYLN